MAIFHNLIQIIQIISAIVVIFLVLMQHGKGADMGAAFGGGASGSVFGAAGSANFLSRSTAIAATVFFASTLMLAFVINSSHIADKNIIQKANNAATVPNDIPVITQPNTTKPAPIIKPDVKSINK